MGAKFIDLTGRKFDRLTVIEYAGKDAGRNSKWFCRCSCGNIKTINGGNLTRGKNKSCGCLIKEITSQRSVTHGMKNSRIYRIWSGMKDRCLNSKSKYFKRYGGRGITVCSDWVDFKVFYKWAISNGYSDSLTLERRKNNEGYQPSNCYWATYKQQENNRSNNRLLSISGEIYTVSQAAEKFNINYSTLHGRIKRGGDLKIPV